jgi:hypothetical protein
MNEAMLPGPSCWDSNEWGLAEWTKLLLGQQ